MPDAELWCALDAVLPPVEVAVCREGEKIGATRVILSPIRTPSAPSGTNSTGVERKKLLKSRWSCEQYKGKSC